MTLQLSREQARRFLATYHFTPDALPGVVERLGTIQYDPLNPVGRNPDLVLQARVPDYCVDDWQQAAYQDRVLYDSWDKQACLVPVSDWPHRAILRELYRPYHDQEILQADPALPAQILSTIDQQGPLSSLEFEDRVRIAPTDSWSGSTRTKRVLRAMWVCGILVTHHRQGGRHYYDRPERVIPSQYHAHPLQLDRDNYHRWIIGRRFQAAGLLRATADPCIWSACGDTSTRKRAIAELVEVGSLTPVQIEKLPQLYYMPTSALPLLDTSLNNDRVIFLGPLDNMLWDRKTLLNLFNFDYVWEVYKPVEQRRWGYYVLPVFYKDRFIARLDSRLERGKWTISRWWWEADVTPDAEMLDALRQSMTRFLAYLRADSLFLQESVDVVLKKELAQVF